MRLRVAGPMTSHKTDPPSLAFSLLPVAGLILFLFTGIFLLKGSPHIPLILAAALVAGQGAILGHKWTSLLDGIVKGISISMPAILILLAIGILIGAWVASGIVPLLIFYGLKILSPDIFLVATCIICSVVSFSTGSSWSTAGTVGVALIGIGQGLGLPLPMVAGAIVSGAYFGDKLSPLSDTTNLAPAVAGSELFEHIRHMLFTTVPSLVIALVLYAVLGARAAGNAASTDSIIILTAHLEELFNLTPWLLLAPLVVLILILRRVPALPALLAGGFAGAILGVLTQGMPLDEMFSAMQAGYVSETGVEEIDELLSRGGLESMLYTVSLIICAMAYGGLLEGTGMLGTISQTVVKLASTTGRLVATTLATCLGMNLLAPDQYLSIIVPGRMYKKAFDDSGLAAKNLSRCLEDAGTLTSPLVPWNTCGTAMMGFLLVNPFAYLPYAFLNLLNPLISLIYGFTGWTMEKKQPENTKEEARKNQDD